LCHRF
jgi:hypothetical protein